MRQPLTRQDGGGTLPCPHLPHWKIARMRHKRAPSFLFAGGSSLTIKKERHGHNSSWARHTHIHTHIEREWEREGEGKRQLFTSAHKKLEFYSNAKMCRRLMRQPNCQKG